MIEMKGFGVEEIVSLVEQLTEREPDSLEIGSAGERIKVYGNFEKVKQFKEKIDNAIGLREYANSLDELEQENVKLKKKMSEVMEKAEEENVDGLGEVLEGTKIEKLSKESRA